MTAIRRIALIGNSHLGAIWGAISSGHSNAFGKHELSFFPAISSLVESYQISDGVLTPTNPRGQNRFKRSTGMPYVNLRQFDDVIIVGHTVGMRWFANLKSYTTFNMHGRTRFKKLVSNAVYEEIVAQTIYSRLGARMARDVFEATGRKPILVVEPMQAWSDQERESWSKMDPKGKFREKITLEAFHRALDDSSKLPARVILQPEETLSDFGLSTRIQFALSPTTIDDRRHMNTTYGAIIIDRIAEMLLL